MVKLFLPMEAPVYVEGGLSETEQKIVDQFREMGFEFKDRNLLWPDPDNPDFQYNFGYEINLETEIEKQGFEVWYGRWVNIPTISSFDEALGYLSQDDLVYQYLGITLDYDHEEDVQFERYGNGPCLVTFSPKGTKVKGMKETLLQGSLGNNFSEQTRSSLDLCHYSGSPKDLLEKIIGSLKDVVQTREDPS
jgi:hypothetical protein